MVLFDQRRGPRRDWCREAGTCGRNVARGAVDVAERIETLGTHVNEIAIQTSSCRRKYFRLDPVGAERGSHRRIEHQLIEGRDRGFRACRVYGDDVTRVRVNEGLE